MAEPSTAFIRDIRAAFTERANPQSASQQQAYMKSALPYYGLKLPVVRQVMRPLLTHHIFVDRDVWESTIRLLWDTATHREEWYSALCIARFAPYKAWRASQDSLPLYDHMIRSGAWWDVCDEIAQHLVGAVLLEHPTQMAPIMRAWSVDERLWIRRCSILSQLRHREQTDPTLLREFILPSIDDTDFFSRKAIGWALRKYSAIEPAWVICFVEEFEDRLSGLSKREALRNIPTL